MQTETLTFESIYNKNHKKVLNYITYKLGNKNKETAEEIANDVFIRVHKHLNNYKPQESSVSTWIFSIANNLVIDHYRRKSLNTFSVNAATDDEGKEMFDHKANVLDPEQTFVNNESGQLVINAINSLPQSYRRLSEMFFLEECSHQEIVNELNIPLNTLKVQIMRSKAMLRELLS